MKYKLRESNPEIARSICQKFKCDPIIADILTRRNVRKADQIKYFLESNISNLHSPFLFNDMETLIQRLDNAALDNEKICIFGDRDADGITSTSLLYNELKAMNYEVSYKLPEGDDPYGITLDTVKQLKAEGINLLITVDCGISCNEEIDELNRLKIDTIVIDHHIPGDVLPDAVAIINPKVKDSGYPFEHLAACAVVAKVIWALRFSKTEFYNTDLILLHAVPGPGEDTTTIIQAVRLENLIVVNSLVEEMPNGMFTSGRSQIGDFLSSGLPIMVLDKETEYNCLKKAFGPNVDIQLYELRDKIEKVLPVVKGKSLYNLSVYSRQALYCDGNIEIETLKSLFLSYCIYSKTSLSTEYEAILDLVAIGTLADLMPLQDENRTLVKLGIKQLNNKPRANIIPLLSIQKLLGKNITSQDIAWYISPVLNASGRLGVPSVGVNLFIEKDSLKIESLTKEIVQLNNERKAISAEAWNFLKSKTQENLEFYGSKFICIQDDSIKRGLTGALAAKALKDNPEIPAAIIIAKVDDTRYTASIRSITSFDSKEFLSRFSSLLIDFGGHKCAGGFSILKENIPQFLTEVEKAVLEMDNFDFDDTHLVDTLLPNDRLDMKLFDTLEILEPFGNENEVITLMMRDVKVMEINQLGSEKKNIKLMLKIGNNIFPGLFWGGYDKVGNTFSAYDNVEIVFRLSKNYFRSTVSAQITILDINKI